MKSIRECVHSAELDLRTLVWTRGASFPLSDLASRPKCPGVAPACGTYVYGACRSRSGDRKSWAALTIRTTIAEENHSMCGRVVQHRDLKSYAKAAGFKLTGEALPNAPPRYNAAPSQELLVVRRDPKTGERRLNLLKWGLLPHWAEDQNMAWKLINARAETVAKLRPFRDAYRQRRCLIPVDGFYEWKTIGKVKQPFLIAMKDGAPFTLAGIWENWKNPSTGEWTRTFTIITTDANELVAQLHDRMPVIIAPEDQERWLNEGEVAADLLKPYPSELMTMWPVSTRANSPKNDEPALLEPVELPEAPTEAGTERVNESSGSEPANSE